MTFKWRSFGGKNILQNVKFCHVFAIFLLFKKERFNGIFSG